MNNRGMIRIDYRCNDLFEKAIVLNGKSDVQNMSALHSLAEEGCNIYISLCSAYKYWIIKVEKPVENCDDLGCSMSDTGCECMEDFYEDGKDNLIDLIYIVELICTNRE